MKRKWKRVALLSLLMGGCFAAGAVASNGIERVDAFLRPDFKVIVDGKESKLDAPILVYNDSGYIPVRSVSKVLGANINWDEPTKSIYINPKFAGQPEVPDNNTTYSEIKMEQAVPLLITYLGREYGVLSINYEGKTYYRVTDLSRMGIDTRSLLKYKEFNTGGLYALMDDVDKLWKQAPDVQVTFMAATSGVYDSELKEYLLKMANETFPQFVFPDNTDYPKYIQVFFIDSLDEHPGYIAMYAYNERYEVKVIVMQVDKDTTGKWYNKGFQIINLDYLKNFFTKK